MTSNTTDRQRIWAVLAVVAAVFVLPALAMGFGMMSTGAMMGGGGHHGMWGSSGGGSGWMVLVGAGFQLLVLGILVGAGYLGFKALASPDGSTDPALEELRAAYAHGDIDDETFERRRERLQAER